MDQELSQAVQESQSLSANLLTLFGSSDKQITANAFENELDKQKMQLLLNLDFRSLSIEELIKIVSSKSINRAEIGKNDVIMDFIMEISKILLEKGIEWLRG
mmetsp:Transcript_33895/g.24943  ORF Transcript_33895/g.24943 Transcript_33895/m.24943 type:complete len:102 (+) Transcript_33895:356-661(+)